MRLSTNTIYEQSINSILLQQESLQKTQQQISNGRRMQTPADDPIAAAQALNVQQTDAINTQYAVNRDNAKNSLALSETMLSSVASLIQDVREEAVRAGNGGYTNNDRAGIADALRGRLDQLVGLANATDSTGRYIFSGYQGATKPFVATSTGAQYAGDQGQRQVQVAASRQIAIGDSGASIFEHVKNGNGVFVTAVGTANSGSAVISTGTVANPASLTGQSYRINFTVAAGATTYSVVNSTTSATLSTGNAYASGSVISFDGLQLDIQGVPINGDTFTVVPTTTPSQSLFTTVKNLIDTLATPVTTAAGRTGFTSGLNSALQNLDNGLDRVLTVQSSIGTRMQELDALDSTGQDLGQQYQQTLSQLQDVDYAKAISDLNRQQAYLEAAQKAFNKVTGLSVFNYL